MSVSESEIKQSVDDSSRHYKLVWGDASKRLEWSFQNALSSESLSLADQDVTDDQVLTDVIPFLNAHPHITALYINNNKIGDRGAKALASNTTLTTLNIGNDIEEEDVDTNYNHPNYNRIGTEGVKALAVNTTLTTLCINNTKIGNTDVRALANNTTLITLDISGNYICDAGAKALADNTTLITLDISGNYICDAGAMALASNTTLRTLDIGSNFRIDTEGVKALAKNKTLITLNINDNNISDAGAMALMRGQLNRIKLRNQNLAFLIALQKKSSLPTVLLRKLLEFIGPNPLKLITGFSFERINALLPTVYHNEVKETKEELEQAFDLQTLKNNHALLKCIGQTCANHPFAHDVPPITFGFSNVLSLSMPVLALTNESGALNPRLATEELPRDRHNSGSRNPHSDHEIIPILSGENASAPPSTGLLALFRKCCRR